MPSLSVRARLAFTGAALAIAAAGAIAVVGFSSHSSQSAGPPPAEAQAVRVPVAVVERREVSIWEEFSGRVEAVERVEVRSRVAGAVQAVHFREGALVAEGDLLITIDPAPFQAEVERLRAQVGAAQARLLLASKELERTRQLRQLGSSALSESTVDQRESAYREAEAALRAAEAALQSAQLNLSYTQIRAPVSGRVGKLEVTVGNLIAAGPGAPVLTSLVSVDPIYVSFNANEEVVVRALKSLDAGVHAHASVDRIPVEITTSTSNGTTYKGHLQLIDNQVDVRSGTVRVRAVFANPHGDLMPGQFARVRMGRSAPQSALLISERAVGTDQSRKFVLVVDAENKAVYREVVLGAAADGLRTVASGLDAGERIVVNGLQRVRPGMVIEPQIVAMGGSLESRTATSDDAMRH
jgi:multidrug efflux system membrane fusion protein